MKKVDDNVILVEKISSDVNPADFGTKIVTVDKFL